MKIKGVLSLISIQSTPVTSVSLALGYASVEGTVISQDIIHLVAVGALAHWAFYSLNDLFDYEWDVDEGREFKPLVGGSLSKIQGGAVFSVLLGVSIPYSILIFDYGALIFWLASYIMGFKYDKESKEETYSAVYMAIWGFCIIFTGALYAGSVTGVTIILALLLPIHMFWMTVMGDLKDVGEGEQSIPERLDCKIINENGYKYLWNSIRFNLLSFALVLSQVILILLIPIGDGLDRTDVIFVYIGIVGGVLVFNQMDNVLYQEGFDRDKMKRDIAKFEIASVSLILVVGVSFMDIYSMIALVAGSTLWGTFWQTVLYGSPLRFP